MNLDDFIYTILFVIFLFTIKPNLIFKPNGQPRIFGLGFDTDGYKKTLFNVQVIIVVFSICILQIKKIEF